MKKWLILFMMLTSYVYNNQLFNYSSLNMISSYKKQKNIDIELYEIDERNNTIATIFINNNLFIDLNIIEIFGNKAITINSNSDAIYLDFIYDYVMSGDYMTLMNHNIDYSKPYMDIDIEQLESVFISVYRGDIEENYEYILPKELVNKIIAYL